MDKTILILNNYSLAGFRNDNVPKHLFYGVDYLNKIGCRLLFLETPNQKGIWHKTETFLRKIPFLNVGYLRMQIQAYKRRNEYDLVYAASQDVTIFLGVLAYFKLYDKKIYALAHHPFLRGQFGKLRRFSLFFAIRGHEKWFALSHHVASQLDLIGRKDFANTVHWGPDMEFYKRTINKNHSNGIKKDIDILCIGRTGRDYETLIKAFNNTDIKLTIYYRKSREFFPAIVVSKNITIIELENINSISYEQICVLCQRAKVMAIPLYQHSGLAGLTSVMDALGNSMPMLITKNNFIELDIEKKGLGYCIDPGDERSWREKTIKILSSHSILEGMSENAKREAAISFNHECFSIEIATGMGL